MRNIGRVMAVALAAAGLSACGSSQQDAAADDAATVATATSEPAAAPTSADGRPAAFGQCAACHSVEKGKHGIGPSLAGVYGTKVGEVEGYAFSPALLASGLSWDDATLDKWLENPRQLVPGNKMTYAGMQDAARRQEIVAYLKTLK